MRDFAGSTKHKPVVFQFDFDEHTNSMVTFDCFLSNFEAMLMETLIANRATLFGDDAINTVLRVAQRFYDKSWLEQALANSIGRALRGKNGHTYTYSVEPERCKQSADTLRQLLNTKQKGKKVEGMTVELAQICKLLVELMPVGDL